MNESRYLKLGLYPFLRLKNMIFLASKTTLTPFVTGSIYLITAKPNSEGDQTKWSWLIDEKRWFNVFWKWGWFDCIIIVGANASWYVRQHFLLRLQTFLHIAHQCLGLDTLWVGGWGWSRNQGSQVYFLKDLQFSSSVEASACSIRPIYYILYLIFPQGFGSEFP